MPKPAPARPRSPGRRISGRAQSDHIRDPYEIQHKPKEPTVCGGCGALYHRGRWQWATAPEGAHAGQCPACRRAADALPAGVITLHGKFALDRKAELSGLARNEEAAEKADHPLNRIMAIVDGAHGIEVHTTDIHLPQRLGKALLHAYRGELHSHFDEAGYFVRVDWHPPG